MNGSMDLIETFQKAKFSESIDVVIAPPTIYISSMKPAGYQLACQNVHFKASGAFTGETSVAMVKELGAKWIIVGHSERRHLFGETNQDVRLKVEAVLDGGLAVILCVGETLEQREANETVTVIQEQLDSALAGRCLDNIVIAYEPVWAIGTGKVATPEQAQQVHQFIRDHLSKAYTNTDGLRIIYGGSVNGANSKALVECEDIDGFLVGGASLKLDEFSTIITNAQ